MTKQELKKVQELEEITLYLLDSYTDIAKYGLKDIIDKVEELHNGLGDLLEGTLDKKHELILSKEQIYLRDLPCMNF